MRKRGVMHCRSEGQHEGRREDGEGTKTNDANDALETQDSIVWLLSRGRCGSAATC